MRFRNENSRKRHQERSQHGVAKRREMAISRRYAKGERPETSKALAELLDKLYGTHFVRTYHSEVR